MKLKKIVWIPVASLGCLSVLFGQITTSPPGGGAGGGGNVSNSGTPILNQLAGWTNSTTIQGITLGTNLSIVGTTLNSTGTGVTSVTQGTGMTFSVSPITSTGTISLTTPVAIANGGTGTATPALVAGTNVTITGSWPNNTINATGGAGAPSAPPNSIQYNNAGAFGGSANLLWTNASNLVTLTGTPAANTVADGFALTDTTAATAGNQQYSPDIHFTGQGWKTTATAASQAVDFRMYLVPVQGAANPTGLLTIDSQINAGGYANPTTISTLGTISAAAAILPGLGDISTQGAGLVNQSGGLRLDGGSGRVAYLYGAQFRLGQGGVLGWTSLSGDPSGSLDTGLARNAASIVEVNNGTAGSLAFLKADRINANGSQPSNASTAAVSAGYASDTYLAGSSVTINTAGAWRAGGAYHLVFDMAKTAAGVATPILTVRMGTLGTTGDAAILTLTFPAGTAAADTGLFELWVNFRTVGAGTSAVIQGAAEIRHNNTTTGLVNTVTGSTEVIVGTSAGFASTTQTVLGVSFNGGASFSGTNTLCQAQLIMP